MRGWFWGGKGRVLQIWVLEWAWVLAGGVRFQRFRAMVDCGEELAERMREKVVWAGLGLSIGFEGVAAISRDQGRV